MTDLRKTAERRLEAASRSARLHWTNLEDSDSSDLDFEGRPLCLLGAGAIMASDLVSRLVEGYDVRAVIDNPRAGRPCPGGIYGTDADFLRIAADEPRILAVLCCGADEGVDHFRRLAEGAGVPVLTVDQARRRVYGTVPDIEELAAILDTDGVYGDPLSQRTVHAVILYRLTLSQKWLDLVRRPRTDMYFDPDVWMPGPDETVIDGGAYTGDTFADFIRLTGGAFRAYHAFEPNGDVLAQLDAETAGHANVTVYRHGLWNKTETLRFTANGVAAHVDAKGVLEVPVRTIDEMGIADPTFVKFDIEGAEAQALEGGRRTIADSRPVLSICAYHKTDDLLVLPRVIHSILPGAILKLRHYSPILYDTVLHALPG
jgi:FkbM family methyltransferase